VRKRIAGEWRNLEREGSVVLQDETDDLCLRCNFSSSKQLSARHSVVREIFKNIYNVAESSYSSSLLVFFLLYLPRIVYLLPAQKPTNMFD